MKRSITRKVSMLVVCACSVGIMLLFAACGNASTNAINTGSTGSTGNTTSGINSITGTIQSVNTQVGSVTLAATVNGQSQQYVVAGLNSLQLADLQQHLGKIYTFQVTQNSNGYTVAPGTAPQETDNAPEGTTVISTPENQGTVTNGQGSISFIGKVQSINANSATVTMPNGDTLSMSITAQTDRGDFNTQINPGQQVKVKVVTNATNGSFIATKLSIADNSDLQDMNTVDFSGFTTSAVGSDNVIHFKVGNKTYNFAAGSTTIMKDFASLQAIPGNQAIQVDVMFNGSNGTITKISNGND